jgi:calcineurin-like phosphoesterase family protein
LNKVSTWFTSDTHFGHANIIQYCNRPYTSLSEMDDVLVTNWNQIVRPNDMVYHLGDFTLGGEKEAAPYFARLNGRISILPGGHDKGWLSKDEYTSKSGHSIVILPPLVTIKLQIPGLSQSQIIVLCHYAMRVWDRSHYGSWQLYGHSHCNLPQHLKSLDVGVDCWDYCPVSLEQVTEEMGKVSM